MAPAFHVANGVVEASQGQPMLYEFITLNREGIIARCRAKVAKRSIPPPSDAEINHGVPLFLDQLVDMLQSGRGTSEIDRVAGQHGHEIRASRLVLRGGLRRRRERCGRFGASLRKGQLTWCESVELLW